MRRLADHVDWQYVFREYWNLYRFGSAGGNSVIRSHLKDVRNRLNAELEINPEVAFDQPNSLPVCAWLGRAMDQGLNEPTAPLVRSLARVIDQLTWRYGYERMRKGLARKYAYSELMGPNGPVISKKLILGLVLFAPDAPILSTATTVSANRISASVGRCRTATTACSRRGRCCSIHRNAPIE